MPGRNSVRDWWFVFDWSLNLTPYHSCLSRRFLVAWVMLSVLLVKIARWVWTAGMVMKIVGGTRK
jgi:hypothetical protein